ncbi:MAG: hypothetical protein CMI26_02210 [Opitutae bacterium]|nr:hypothetical protein [Opitutae bacterium]
MIILLVKDWLSNRLAVRSMAYASVLACLPLEAKPLFVPEPALEEALSRTLQVSQGELTEELVAEKLLRFELNGAGIRDLTGLEAAENLISLVLRDNHIEDISPITELAHLRRLDLSGNRIRDLKKLDSEGLLASIRMTSRVREIRKESESPRLTPFQINALKLELLSIHTKRQKAPWQLEELRVANNRLRGLSGISNYRELRMLDVSNNGLIDLEGISALKNLEVLHLQGNQLGAPEPYEDQNKNKFFDANEPFSDLSGNGRRDHDPFGALQGLLRLKELYLFENRITELSSMSNLPSLEILLLGANELTNANDFKDFTSLRRLVLSDNHLSDVRGLFDMTNLEYLYLTENRLSDLRALRKLISLRELHLQHNHFTDIQPVANLDELRVLGLSGNFVSDLSPIKRLIEKKATDSERYPELTRLGIADNILDLKDAETLDCLEQFRVASIRVTLGNQNPRVTEMGPLLTVLMGDKIANLRLGNLLKDNRYERLYDFAKDSTLPTEDKVDSYLTWVKTLKSGEFDDKADLAPK